jgi:hypothetical protein
MTQLTQTRDSLPQARTTDLVTREMPDELLVYDLKRHKAHCLNQTAAAVWKHCDGNTSVAEIASAMESDLQAEVEESTVWLAIERLGKANLLETRVAPPAGTAGISRREALRKLKLGASLAAPLVISVIAPTAARAATCAGVNNNMNLSAPGCLCMNNNDCSSACCMAGNNDTCHPGNLAPGASCTFPCQCTSNMCPNMGANMDMCVA